MTLAGPATGPLFPACRQRHGRLPKGFFFWVHHKTWNSCSKHRAIFLLLPLQISAHDVLHCRRARQHERKKCGWHSPAGMRQQVQFRLASRAAEYSSLSCWLGHTPGSLLQSLCNGKSALSRAFQHGLLRHQHDDISHHCSATPERLNKHALPSELLNRSPEELRWHAWSSSWTLADVRSARSCHLNRLLRLLEHGAPPSHAWYVPVHHATRCVTAICLPFCPFS